MKVAIGLGFVVAIGASVVACWLGEIGHATHLLVNAVLLLNVLHYLESKP